MTNLPDRVLIAAVGVLVSFVVALLGAGPDTARAQNPSAALLTPADLPAGWSTAPNSIFQEAGSDLYFGSCAGDGPAIEPRGFDSITFEASRLGLLLVHAVAVFAPGDAARTLAYLRDNPDTCLQLLQEELEPGAVRVSSLAFPQIGDETVAERLDVNVGFGTLRFDMVTIRRGNTLSMLILMDLGSSMADNSALLERLARSADERIAHLAP